jgi:mRNA export factor
MSLQEGDKIFSGGADGAGCMFDVNTGQATEVAQHEAPIKAVGWVDAKSGILATGSWDKTIKVMLLLSFFLSAINI